MRFGYGRLRSKLMDWKATLLINRWSRSRESAGGNETIAVLGIKPESHATQPAFYVPKYMADNGYEIIPVPVYYPEVTEILGNAGISRPDQGPRRDRSGEYLSPRRRTSAKHTYEISSRKSQRPVWFQLGITNDEVAEKFGRGGDQGRPGPLPDGRAPECGQVKVRVDLEVFRRGV